MSRLPTGSDKNGRRIPPDRSLFDAIDVKVKVAEVLCDFHAMTREGLLQKARAALVLADIVNVTNAMRIDMFKSLAVDLIHLVPTLIDERGRSIARSQDDGEGVL